MKVSELLAEGVQGLASAGVEGARTETELLLGFCLNVSRTFLYLSADQGVADNDVRRFRVLLRRRMQREPFAYITGEREFWSLPFFVSPAVLIPRPETEFLLETVLSQMDKGESRKGFIDLCCGSGIIATVLAIELGSSGCAVDISSAALQVARKNLCRHRVDSRVFLVQSDLFGGFRTDMRYSLIVSNPPYVRRAELDHGLEPEVAEYEPHLALDGGIKGLDVIKRIRDILPDVLARGGDCFLEIGDGQAETIRRLFLEHDQGALYEFVHLFKDYSGRDRVVHIRRKNS